MAANLLSAAPHTAALALHRRATMASPGKEVNAEVFSFLHVELVEHTLGAAPSDADFQKAALKLEAIGFAVGHRLVERYTRDRPRFSDTLEIIKFICKDFWCAPRNFAAQFRTVV